MSMLSQKIFPSVGSIKRLIQRRRVDLPDPERPITTRNSPSATSKLTSVRARVPFGYVFERCSTLSMVLSLVKYFEKRKTCLCFFTKPGLSLDKITPEKTLPGLIEQAGEVFCFAGNYLKRVVTSTPEASR